MTSVSTPHLEGPPQAAAESRRAGWLGRAGRLAASSSLRNGALSVLDQAIVSGTSFATSIIIGRACGTAEFGVYFLALSFVLFSRAVQSDLISSPYMVYCHRRQGDDLATYGGSTLVHQAVLTGVLLVGLLCLGGLHFVGAGPAGMAATTPVLMAAVPFLLLREFIRNLSFAHLRVKAAVLTDIFVAIVQLGGLLLLAGTKLLTVELAFAVMGAACALACAGWFLGRKQPLRFSRREIAADWRENWLFARWAVAGQIVGRGASYVIPWIIALWHGEAETGLLAACITLVNMAGTFVTGVSNFLTPKAAQAFTHRGVRALKLVLSRAAVVFLTVVGGFCLLMLVAGDQIVTFVYGGKFTDAGPIVTILALGMLANSLGLTAGNGLWALDRPRANFLADVATLLVTMAVMVALVGRLGASGAAIAMTCGSVAGALLRFATLWSLLSQVRRELETPGLSQEFPR